MHPTEGPRHAANVDFNVTAAPQGTKFDRFVERLKNFSFSSPSKVMSQLKHLFSSKTDGGAAKTADKAPTPPFFNIREGKALPAGTSPHMTEMFDKLKDKCDEMHAIGFKVVTHEGQKQIHLVFSDETAAKDTKAIYQLGGDWRVGKEENGTAMLKFGVNESARLCGLNPRDRSEFGQLAPFLASMERLIS
jgi:hypothetical protein